MSSHSREATLKMATKHRVSLRQHCKLKVFLFCVTYRRNKSANIKCTCLHRFVQEVTNLWFTDVIVFEEFILTHIKQYLPTVNANPQNSCQKYLRLGRLELGEQKSLEVMYYLLNKNEQSENIS